MVCDQVEDPPPENGGAFDAYYRFDNKRLIGFVMKLGATLQEAEDAAHEAMAEVFTRWDRIGSTNPAAYARTTAENKYIRSQARARSELKKLQLADWASERSVSDVHDFLLKEEARGLITMMQELPMEQRRVLAWYADGFEVAAIAEAIERPEATVRSNLRHARKSIKKRMAVRDDAATVNARKEAG